MLAIQVNNQFLQLEDDAAITVRIRFDVLSFENKEGSYTIPFSLPNNGFNRKVLGFPGRITNAAHTLEYADVRIWHSGKVMYIGNLVIEVSDGEIEGYIEIGNGSFWAQTQDVKLNELDIEADFVPSISNGYDIFNAAANSSWPTFKFAVFPIYAPNYQPTDSVLFPYNEVLNPWTVNELDEDQDDLFNYVIAQPYLCYILKEIFSYYNYNIVENWIETSEFAKLTLLNLRSDKVKQSNTDFDYLFRFKSLPEVNLQKLVTGLETLLAVKFLFDNESQSVRIIDVNTVIESNTVTDVTRITEEATGLAHENAISFVLSQSADSNNNADEAAEPDFGVDTEDYVESGAAGNSSTHETAITILSEDSDFDTHYYDDQGLDIFRKSFNWPRTDIEFTNYWKSGLILQFYRGKQFDVRIDIDGHSPTPAETPLGTAGTTDVLGNEITGAEHSLHWGGEKGLYAKRWKNYFWWYKNIRKPIDREIWFSASQLKSLDPTAKIRINEVNYIAEGYEVTLFADKVSAAKCDLVVV